MPSPDAKQNVTQRIIAVWQMIPGGALLFAVVPLLLLSYFGWYYYGAEHIDQAFYSVRKEQMTLTPQPAWIKHSVLDQVFEAGNLGRLSLLDPSSTATIAQAFEANPWVRSTMRVTKNVGSKVSVDVVFRRPLAMVHCKPGSREIAREQQLDLEAGFFPVDEQGILLPVKGNFSVGDLANYFLIYADGGAWPRGDFGMPFGDPRITEALKLCSYLEPERESLQIQRIKIEQDNRLSGRNDLVFVLQTADKHQIRWGHAPEAEGVGEPLAAKKLNSLAEWLQKLRSASATASHVDLLSTTTPVSSLQRPR